MRTLSLLLAALVLSGPAHAEDPAEADDTPGARIDRTRPAKGTVLRPTFTLAEGSFSAGIAFVIEVDGSQVAVTPYHLFGPPGGLDAVIPAKDLPTAVRGGSLRDGWSDKRLARVSAPLPLPDAAPLGTDAHLDLVVLPVVPNDPNDLAARMSGQVVASSRLADAAPSKGDKVWLVGPRVGATQPGAVAASIVDVAPHALYYRFDDPTLDLVATNGAPIIDEAGHVVGMHLGGGAAPDGALIGVANPATDLAARIRKAMAGSKP